MSTIQNNHWWEKPYLRWITLFVTSTTLVCCAIPIILVSLGFGAVVASLNYNIPALVFLGENKVWTLSISALFLVFLTWVVWRPGQQCPSDPDLATRCQTAQRWNRRILIISATIWSVGFFFSVLLLPLSKIAG